MLNTKAIFLLLLFTIFSTSLLQAEFENGKVLKIFEGDFHSVKELAAKEGKLLMLEFYADWCLPCRMLNKYGFKDPAVGELLEKSYLAYKVNVDSFNGIELKQRYNVKILPTILIFNTNGELIERNEGTMTTTQLIQTLESHDLPANKVKKNFETILVSETPKVEDRELQNKATDPIIKKSNNTIAEIFTIQLAALTDEQASTELFNQAAKNHKYTPRLDKLSVGDKILYRVTLGKFTTKAEALSAAEGMNELGYITYVRKV